MKKIIILNSNNTYNYGSFMMLINFIYYVNEKEPHIFYIEFDGMDDFTRLKKELGESIDIQFLQKKQFLGKRGIKQKINRFFYLFFSYNSKLLELKADKVVVLGGDDISNYYSKIQLLLTLRNLKKLTKTIQVYLIGQTIGPFDFYMKKIIRNYLEYFHISLRDSFCQKYLQAEVGIKKDIPVFSDLAFLPLPKQIEGLNTETFNENNLKENEYIVFVPSGLYKKYTNNRENYLQNIQAILDYLSKTYSDKNIVLLGHVLKPQSVNDVTIITELVKEKESFSGQIIVITEPILASEARYILGNSYMTITGRMHSAISSFQMLNIPISLSYSIKYKGIICDDMGLEELVIDAKGDDKWEKNNLVNTFKTYIEDIENKRELLQMKIKDSVSIQRERALSNIDYFLKK